MRFRCSLSAFAGLLLLVAQLDAAPPTPREMAAKIDQHFEAFWKKNKVKVNPPASDSEFVRRAWLDLIGIIPPLNERALGKDKGNFGVLGYLDNRSSEKRYELVDFLLNKPRHATHMATRWRNAMLPRDNNQLRFRDQGFPKLAATTVRGQSSL